MREGGRREREEGRKGEREGGGREGGREGIKRKETTCRDGGRRKEGEGREGKKEGGMEEGKRERTVFFLGPTQKRVAGEFLGLPVLQLYFS